MTPQQAGVSAALAKWLHLKMSAAQNLPYNDGDTCEECVEAVQEELLPLLKLEGRNSILREVEDRMCCLPVHGVDPEVHLRHVIEAIYSLRATAPPEQACPYKAQHNVGYRCPHCGVIEQADPPQPASAGALSAEQVRTLMYERRIYPQTEKVVSEFTLALNAQLAAHDQATLPAKLTLDDIVTALNYASEGRKWAGGGIKPDLLANQLNRVIARYADEVPIIHGQAELAAHDQKVSLKCDSCKQDLSLISRGHYTILCHKPDCYSLKDGHEANVALVKTVRALGMRVRELESQLEGKNAATIR